MATWIVMHVFQSYQVVDIYIPISKYEANIIIHPCLSYVAITGSIWQEDLIST